MDLIIDIGNTNTKLALFKGGELIEISISKELSVPTIKNFLQREEEIQNCILSAVTKYPQDTRSFLREHFHFIELDEKTPLPIKNRYQTPGTLGKDRLAAAVAGNSLFPGRDVLVINVGTCITYDFVNQTGDYLGGAISPGMVMRFRALNTFTGKLPLVDFTEEPEFPGDTTEKSIISGVINGMIAEMEANAAVLGLKYPDLQVILSGGDLNYFDKRLKISIFAFPNIVVYGLYQILKLNVDPNR